jgi:translation initiation factor 2A
VSLNSPPTSQKTFFKADRAQIKWNTLGTQVLLLTQTEVDNTNKSYYGETGMYLLTAAGHFDCRVTLDKEGPIHDFAWSPNSKEFGVVYGCECPFLEHYSALLNRGLYRYARQDGTL